MHACTCTFSTKCYTEDNYNFMIGCFRGMSPAAAELMYIKLAQQLPEYGHEIYQALVHIHVMCIVMTLIIVCFALFVSVQNIHGSSIWLGACFIGVFVKHSNGQPNIYFK